MKSSLFIRPRRFGKSLLLSMLENYYDIARKDLFPAMFGHLAIGADPTPLRNSYFILRWDFSCVDPTGTSEEMRQSLFNHINVRIGNFIVTTQHIISSRPGCRVLVKPTQIVLSSYILSSITAIKGRAFLFSRNHLKYMRLV